MKDTPWTPRGNRYHVDFPGKDLPLYLHLPGIKKHPTVVNNIRVRFSLGLTKSATFHQIQEKFNYELERRYYPQEHTTLEKAFEFILKGIDASDRTEQTKAEKRRIAQQFIQICKTSGITLASELNATHVTAYKTWMSSDVQIPDGTIRPARKPAGVHSYLVQLGALLKDLKVNGFLPQGYDKDTWFQNAKVKRGERSWRTYSQDELDTILADPEYGELYRYLYLSGARVGVVLQLRPQNIDWKKGLITYPPGKQDKIHIQKLTPALERFLKGKQPNSMGFLFWDENWKWKNPFDKKQLRAAETRINKHQKKIIIRALHSHRMIENTGPGRSKKQKGQRLPIIELMKELDLPKVHDIRATTATRLLMLGMDPVSISKYIGWEDASVFLEHYCRLNPDVLNVPDLEGFQDNVRSFGRK